MWKLKVKKKPEIPWELVGATVIGATIGAIIASVEKTTKGR